MVVTELNNQCILKNAAKIKLEKLNEINELINKVEEEIKELKQFAKKSEKRRKDLKETFQDALKNTYNAELNYDLDNL